MSSLIRCAAVMGLMYFAVNTASAKELPVADLVREVKVALTEVQDEADASKLPALASVELTIKAAQSTGAGGKVSLFAVVFGANVTSEATSTVYLKLVPPEPGSAADISAVSLSEQLVPLILAGAKGVAAAGQGQPKLEAAELSATIEFAIKADGSGGFKLVFPPFEVSAEGGVKSSQIHVVKVSYKAQ